MKIDGFHDSALLSQQELDKANVQYTSLFVILFGRTNSMMKQRVSGYKGMVSELKRKRPFRGVRPEILSPVML